MIDKEPNVAAWIAATDAQLEEAIEDARRSWEAAAAAASAVKVDLDRSATIAARFEADYRADRLRVVYEGLLAERTRRKR